MKNLIVDLIEPQIGFTLEESKEVDGVHILGKVRGQFFVPEGYSRNNRYYPRELWERVIKSESIQKKLKERRMFGTIGHNTPINDETIAQGRISHIVTNLYIDQQGRGIGEALILNTPAGRVLNTLLRAGAKLYVSSRAYGEYEGKDPTGRVPALKPDSYELITFDFVYEPGFLQANPQLVESIKEDLKQCIGDDICSIITEDKSSNINSNSDKEDSMALEGVVEQLSREKAQLEVELDKVLQENEELRKKVEELQAALEVAKSTSESVSKIEGELKATKEQLSKYEEFGTPDEIEEALERSKEVLEKYARLGTPEEIEEALRGAKEILEQYKELGTPSEVKMALEKAKSELMELSRFREEVGSLSQVEEFLEDMKDILTKMVEEKRAEKVEALTKEFRVSKEVVEKLLQAMSEDEARRILGKMSESVKYATKYSIGKRQANESTSNEPSIFKPRTVRLAESFLK